MPESRLLTRGLDVDYRQQNYLDFESDKRFDLITLIYCDFCPLSPAQRKRLLEIFHRHLNDEGTVLLDVFSLQAFESRQESNNLPTQVDGWFLVGIRTTLALPKR